MTTYITISKDQKCRMFNTPFAKWLLVCVLFLGGNGMHAATITVINNSNWSGIGTVTAADVVVIKKGATLTVDVTNAVCASIELGGTGASKGAGTLTFAASGSPVLTVSGTVTIGAGASGGTQCFGVLTMVSGATLSCRGFAIIATTGNAYTPEGTVTLTAANTLPSTIVTSFSNLTINHAAATTTLGASLSISGTLTMTSGTLTIDAFTLSLNGSFSGSSTNALIGSASSNLTIGGTGTIGNLFFSQTTDGTTNKIATFTMNRSGQTVALGNSMHAQTALTLTNGKFNINGQTLTLNGNFTGTSTNCLVGSTSSNLTIGGSGSMTSNLFFDASAATLNNLTINRSAVTITLGNALEVYGALTVTAGTLATGGFLVIASNSTTTGRVAAITGTISGDVTVQRFVPSSARRWRFLSSPVAGRTLADLQDDIYVTGSGAGMDATLTNAPSVYTYNESVITGTYNNGWVAAAANTEALTVGKGYRIFIRGTRVAGRLDGTLTTQDDVTLDFTGALNTGNINMSPTYTSSGVDSNDGWNLMGNPYASPIDWNAFHDAGRTGSDPDFSGTDYTHLSPTVYVFDGSTNSYKSYNASANSGTLTDGVIPLGCAFLIKADTVSPTMTMKETYKATPVVSYFKNTYVDKNFRIKLIRDSITSDEMVIKYIDSATLGNDGYDISKMWGPEVNIASLSAANAYLTLDSKPFNGLFDTTRVAVFSNVSGTVRIVFSNADEFLSYTPITLLDRYLNTQTNLRTSSVYTFSIDKSNPATFGDNRFLIVVGELPEPKPTQDTPQVQLPATITLSPTVFTSTLTLTSSVAVVGNSTVEVRDMRGVLQKTYINPVWNNKKLVLDLAALPVQNYIVTVRIGNQNPVSIRCVKTNTGNR